MFGAAATHTATNANDSFGADLLGHVDRSPRSKNW
jgi:hypothetical protein